MAKRRLPRQALEEEEAPAEEAPAEDAPAEDEAPAEDAPAAEPTAAEGAEGAVNGAVEGAEGQLEGAGEALGFSVGEKECEHPLKNGKCPPTKDLDLPAWVSILLIILVTIPATGVLSFRWLSCGARGAVTGATVPHVCMRGFI